MTTLRQLVTDYGANGFVLTDRGSGSAGPCFVDWDDETEATYGDTEMLPISPDALIDEPAYPGQDVDSVLDTAQLVLPGYEYDTAVGMFASDWIDDSEYNSQGLVQSHYEHRIIF